MILFMQMNIKSRSEQSKVYKLGKRVDLQADTNDFIKMFSEISSMFPVS